MIIASYDVIEPKNGIDPINALLQVANSRQEAELTLQPTDGGDPFPLVVSDVIVRYDSSGAFMADAVTSLGKVTCRIFKDPPPGQPVGKVTISTRGDLNDA